MLGCQLGRSTKRSVRMWVTGWACLVLLVLSLLNSRRGPDHSLWNTIEYRRYWRPATPLVMGRYPGKFLPFLVFPVLEERPTKSNLLLESFPEQQLLLSVTPSPLHHTPGAGSLTYTLSAPPPSTIRLSPAGAASWTPWEPQLRSVADYFRYLRTPQTHCRKLKRLGGAYLCKAGQGDENNMDNHKYVCMDPALEVVGAKVPQDCLTLSFGTQYDTTFDDAVSELPCEVHMFDVLNFNPQLARETDHVHFHVEGLAGQRHSVFYNNMNRTVKMSTLRDHVMKNNLFPRPIHVLKVDIENSEWEAFRDIAQNPLFDAVGQVALEVHATELVHGPTRKSPPVVPRQGWLHALQTRYDVLTMIEARGFRRVLYWDNIQDGSALYDENGTKYETAGELLYVNTNWYNASFKRQLATYGFKFRGLT
ncbi:probable methyltransferase-like protein 24 [Panulirus ornatus]|uniref:probable methyltransferase-like protein 24 n=1 Tax=Panulirus ornatus TaxID=150431 RepID=UPI003A860E8F